MFLARTDTKVIELSGRGYGAERELTLPRGWYVPNWGSIGVGRGILVRSGDAPKQPHTVMAIWNPGTGALKVIGRDIEVMAAYTPPGARYSLLAWEPSRCSAGPELPAQDHQHGDAYPPRPCAAPFITASPLVARSPPTGNNWPCSPPGTLREPGRCT